MSPRRARAVSDRAGDPVAALREHLVDAAERLLSERQVSAITTRDIARTADVSEGVLYNYFADKNDLLLTALVQRFEHLVARFRSDLPAAGVSTVADNLAAYSRALLELNADVLPIVGKLLTEPSLLRRFMDEIHRQPLGGQQIRETLVEYLATEQRNGRVAAADMGAAADLLTGAVAMLTFIGLIGGATQEEVAQRLSAVVDTLLRGLDRAS